MNQALLMLALAGMTARRRRAGRDFTPRAEAMPREGDHEERIRALEVPETPTLPCLRMDCDGAVIPTSALNFGLYNPFFETGADVEIFASPGSAEYFEAALEFYNPPGPDYNSWVVRIHKPGIYTARLAGRGFVLNNAAIANIEWPVIQGLDPGGSANQQYDYKPAGFSNQNIGVTDAVIVTQEDIDDATSISWCGARVAHDEATDQTWSGAFHFALAGKFLEMEQIVP